MSYRFFDQRVVNPLERPTSVDPNTAGSQDSTTLRLLAQQLLMPYGYTAGFFGDGFKVLPTAPASMGVSISTGYGFRQSDSFETSIGGVQGVNDTAANKPLPLNVPKTVTLNTAPATGFCRRDIIAVRQVPHLMDAQSTRVLNPGLQSFSYQTKFKTMSWILDNYDVTPLAVGGTSSFVTEPLVYAPGVVVPYTAPESLLLAPIPDVPADHTLIAVINVVGGNTSILENHIADYRNLLVAGGQATIVGRPEIGAAVEGTPPVLRPGAVLNNAALTLPTGVRAFLARGFGISNTYQLIVIGLPGMRDIQLNAIAYQGGLGYQPIGCNIEQVMLNQAAQLNDVLLWSDSASAPYGGSFAIGQPFTSVQFSIGTPVYNGDQGNRLQFDTNATAFSYSLDPPMLKNTISLQLTATLLT